MHLELLQRSAGKSADRQLAASCSRRLSDGVSDDTKILQQFKFLDECQVQVLRIITVNREPHQKEAGQLYSVRRLMILKRREDISKPSRVHLRVDTSQPWVAISILSIKVNVTHIISKY